MQSKAKTVHEYLAELPADRREALQALRAVILKNIDPVYVEGMGYGMPGWSVPHSVYPAGYHCDPKIPLPYAGMASQKNHMSLYLMCIYGHTGEDKWFRDAWAKTGKKLDMGKSCIRFKKIDDLALDVIAEAFKRTPAHTYIEFYEKTFKGAAKRAAKRKGSAQKSRSKSTKPGSKAASKAGNKSPERKRRVKPVTGKNAAKQTAKRK
ncbi:MAG: DUF1801 domain-containing protein [Planctomycetes bacterium]|nr:DUF1801 domain-containing protein [Planctomycetota bacterium]